MGLNETPRGNRLHIAIYGKRNSGKSSLINALTGQDTALVSENPGTTTDPVFKAMELHPIGPVVFIDTAGFDDEGEIGALRIQRTENVLSKTDIALVVIDGAELAQNRDNLKGLPDIEERWVKRLRDMDIPVITVVNKCDIVNVEELPAELPFASDKTVFISAASGQGLEELRRELELMVPEDVIGRSILGRLGGELVLLVMPQDIQAPKGRLILPQVQTIRELLDRKTTVVATTADGMAAALDSLKRSPDLIITDSQCFDAVYTLKPPESKLTSFSILFAAYKGDLAVFVEGASALDDMTENSRVLIGEACTHVPLSEDIGREKIPNLLRKRFGQGMEIVNVCGNDFPDAEALKEFDLVIHCGACMFNRRHVLSRIAVVQEAGVPISNYGIVLAKLSGILDKISF